MFTRDRHSLHPLLSFVPAGLRQPTVQWGQRHKNSHLENSVENIDTQILFIRFLPGKEVGLESYPASPLQGFQGLQKLLFSSKYNVKRGVSGFFIFAPFSSTRFVPLSPLPRQKKKKVCRGVEQASHVTRFSTTGFLNTRAHFIY